MAVDPDKPAGKQISRREFLKYAGATGAAIGLSTGLGGLVAACEDEEEPSGSTETSVSTGPEMGREIKIGLPMPQTGMLAVFAIADDWSLDLWDEYVGENVVMGDGKSHKVTFVRRDSQSDSNRAAQIASDLALNDKVDLINVGGGPDTVMPVADQAEALEVPLVSINCPWPAFVFGRGGAPDQAFKWTYGMLFGIDQAVECVIAPCDKIETNKKAGLFFANTADSQAWLQPGIGMEDALKAAGYTPVLPGLYNPGADDFTALISTYKQEGCELLLGSNPGRDFAPFWQQCLQQGFRPKVVHEHVGLQSVEDMTALGDSCIGITVGNSWNREWPFTDSVTGMTCPELADSYEAAHNSLWNNFITAHARFGWTLDLLERVKDPDSSESWLEAITTTKLETCAGFLDFTVPVDPTGIRPHPNVNVPAWGASQITKGGKFGFERPMIYAIRAPGAEVKHEVTEMSYS
jgi:branched-chain amino acid transport system substrate-binding protein